MEHHELTSERRLLLGALVGFITVALLASLDLASDLGEGMTLRHAAAEGGAFVVAVLGALFMVRRLINVVRSERAAREEALALAEQLQATKTQAARWRDEAREFVQGLAVAIDRQFERWALSPAEKEVGLLLLKGLSHKEIAAIRSITEATARQQARALYKKAGLSGRNDLAAFFLEDLLLPAADGSSQAKS